MAKFVKDFQKPYAEWKDLPDKSTPITATIKNAESNAIDKIETFLAGHDLDDNDTKISGMSYALEQMTIVLRGKADASSVYSKSEVYAKTETYEKSEVYNKTETYTKKEVEDYVEEHGGGGGEVPDDIVLWEEPSEVEIPAIQQPLHRFSTEEKVVGYWVDGKPIYEKTYYNSISTFMNGHTWYDTDIPTESKETIVDCKFTNFNGTPFPIAITKGVKDGYLSGMHYRNASMQMNGNYTIQYTKTTD